MRLDQARSALQGTLGLTTLNFIITTLGRRAMAVLAGVGSGYLWSVLMNRVPTLLKTRFSTPDFVFIL
ncbi:hypothetical protein [uncultured Hymenobacter sp.]|uniref:hypothetical protein n=1 Tax=uncultured Hymenobacter sp. TaxID=170016 RepID=UPI0035CC2343